MFRWRIYLITLSMLAPPIAGLWLQAWHIGVGLKWLEPEADLLVIASLSIGASALLALFVTRSLTGS